MVELVEIKEGMARVLVPKSEWSKGPHTSRTPVFYNPVMELNRDLSVSILRAIHRKNMDVLDGLAASGIRGIRFALEVGDIDLYMNDWNRKANELMKINANINGVDANIFRKNLNALLSEMHFDYIDIDPFGSPAEFFDSSSRSIKNGGIIAITATDTAVLCGVYPKVCYRRYLAIPKHNWCMHEIGLRILIGNAVRMAARNDVALTPILSYSADHYFRVYLRAKKGARNANKALENRGYMGFSEVSWFEGGNTGPMWLAKLHDMDVLERIKVEDFFGTRKRITSLIKLWKEELNMPIFYYELPNLSSMAKRSTPKMDRFIENLRGMGYVASRTHFSPTAIKTDAPVDVLLKLIEEGDRRC